MSVWPSIVAAAIAIACGGCGSTASSSREPVVMHPTCDESCRGHCEDTAEACADRCERECAPAPAVQ